MTVATSNFHPTPPPVTTAALPLPGIAVPATGVAPNYGADKLAAQIEQTLTRCRRLGHRDPAVTLTRPTGVVLGVEMLLTAAGFTVQVTPARTGGCSVLTVRG